MWLSTMISVGRSSSARKSSNARGDQVEVVGVADPGDVPAVAHEAGGDVVVVGDLGVAVDRDVVVVVDPAEVVELLVAGERGGLVRDALHQAAVAGDRVDVEVEELGPAVERAACHLAAIAMPTVVAIPWPSGPVVVSTPEVQRYSGWPGALRVELAEVLDVVEGDGRLADDLVVGVDRLHLGRWSSE